IDTTAPICGNASQRQHGMIGNDGDKNIVDSVEYIASRVWADEQGRDRVGVVLIADHRVFAAREVQKADARPGGFTVTGGHGGILGAVGHEGPPVLTYIPTRRHTYQSQVNVNRLPSQVKNEKGELLESAIPKVTIIKDANYSAERPGGEEDDPDLLALIERNLSRYPLSGFVVEGHVPYGTIASATRAKILKSALGRGIAAVCVGRGNNEGFSPLHITVGIDSHLRLLPAAKVLAGAEAVAVVVHAEIADGCAILHPGAGHVGAAVRAVARPERLGIVALQVLALAFAGKIVRV